jgi:hypothetical protein
MSPKPFLMIDVDGVVNVFGGRDPDRHSRHRTGVGYTVTIDRRHGAWLAELGRRFELAWATMWEQDAPAHIGPLLDLPAMPYARMHRTGARTITEIKIPGIEHLAGPRPLAWLDDDHDPISAQWAQRRTMAGIPTLIVPVDPHLGITRQQVDLLARFAETTDASPSAA